MFFSGIIGGVTANIQILPIGTNAYEFKISGVPATLVKPVTIKLTIGNDSGELTF